jgi:hypothetical protein
MELQTKGGGISSFLGEKGVSPPPLILTYCELRSPDVVASLIIDRVISISCRLFLLFRFLGHDPDFVPALCSLKRPGRVVLDRVVPAGVDVLVGLHGDDSNRKMCNQQFT